MFKYFGFRNSIGFLTKTMADKIEGMVSQQNLTWSEVEDHCQRAENEAIKKEFEAILLSTSTYSWTKPRPRLATEISLQKNTLTF